MEWPHLWKKNKESLVDCDSTWATELEFGVAGARFAIYCPQASFVTLCGESELPRFGGRFLGLHLVITCRKCWGCIYLCFASKQVPTCLTGNQPAILQWGPDGEFFGSDFHVQKFPLLDSESRELPST